MSAARHTLKSVIDNLSMCVWFSLKRRSHTYQSLLGPSPALPPSLKCLLVSEEKRQIHISEHFWGAHSRHPVKILSKSTFLIGFLFT